MSTQEDFDDILDDCAADVVICGIIFSPSQILKACDPIAYRVYLADYENNRQAEDEDEDEGEMK